MSTPTRWVIVDDTSTDIDYDGHDWFSNVGGLDDIGDYGPPYRSTLHGTNVPSSLSYKFSGTRIRAWGTNAIRNDSGHIDPQWECFVDNVSIGSAPAFQYQENNWLICPETPLKDRAHTLTIEATVTTNQTFWFDRIDYVPSPSVSLADKAILVAHNDSNLQFGSGWGSYGDYAQGTSTQGSVFVFNFYGVSVAWYGYTPGEFPGNSSLATWKIDDQPAQTFVIKGYTDQSQLGFNRKFFETSSFPAGPHRLLVTHNGTAQTTPLNLVYLVVQNGTADCSSSARGTRTAANGVCATSTSSIKAAHGGMSNSQITGAIIGGVIGGVVILAFVIFIFYRTRSRKTTDHLKNKGTFGFPIRVATESIPMDHGPEKLRQHSVQEPSAITGSNYHSTASINGPYCRAEGQSGTRKDGRTLVGVHNPDNDQTSPTSVFHSENQSSASNGPEAPRVIVHQDSGVRLRQQQEPVIDIPPHYTPL